MKTLCIKNEIDLERNAKDVFFFSFFMLATLTENQLVNIELEYCKYSSII